MTYKIVFLDILGYQIWVACDIEMIGYGPTIIEDRNRSQVYNVCICHSNNDDFDDDNNNNKIIIIKMMTIIRL